MGVFSSLFASRTSRQVSSRSDRLADLCIKIRQEMGFLDYYLSNRTEKSGDLMRFQFSKDVLMLLMSFAAVRTTFVDEQEFMQFNERVRSRYLRRLPVPPTSLVGDCLVCEDELEAIARFVAPNVTLSDKSRGFARGETRSQKSKDGGSSESSCQPHRVAEILAQ